MSILAWLGLGEGGPGPGAPDPIRRVAREMASLEPERARFLALFAFLLARVANVDLEPTEAETREMADLVARWGRLSPEQAALVVKMAAAQNQLFGATQNFLAARELRDRSTEEERRALVDCLFAVAAADGAITGEEEEAIREISRELLLTNDDYLAIRSAYHDRRSVVQGRG